METFILLCVVIVVVALVINYRRQRAAEMLRTTAVSLIEPYAVRLRRKKEQLVIEGEYGEIIDHAWQNEKDYFYQTIFEPALLQSYNVSQLTPAMLAHRPVYQNLCGAAIEAAVAALGPLRRPANNSNDQMYLIDPLEFERWCAVELQAYGWKARTTKGSGDQGVDVIAERDGRRVVLQCKLYSQPVGNKAVQEAYAAIGFEEAQAAYVVTNNSYTKSARALAKKNGIVLLRMDELSEVA